jgi:hypothetical protein
MLVSESKVIATCIAIHSGLFDLLDIFDVATIIAARYPSTRLGRTPAQQGEQLAHGIS